mgnify:CR=1 FL=1
MPFEKGISGNPSGRPRGSKNQVSKAKMYSLLDTIVDDLTANYDKLSTNNKLRILCHFNTLYKTDEEIQNEIEPRVFQVINDSQALKKAFNIE